MVLKGIGVSAGRTKGKLLKRHIERKNEVYSIESAIICVDNLSFEVVANAIIEKNVVGIIAERGGICSHGATLAREFRLPCIVYRDKEEKLTHNDTTCIDGSSGTVEVFQNCCKNNLME